MVEAADELRERLRVVLAENGVDEAPATLHSWRCEYPERYGKCDCIAELVTDLAAVVAEACTEGAIAELEYLSADTAKTLQVWTPSDLNERAAALRGVGNQNAEPRWSANRLEEVLREGLPDQNAEPEWEWGYGHESESGLVPVLGFEGPYSEGRSRDIAEKQMNDDLRWRYPLALMKRRKAGPWLPADQKGTEQ